MTLRRKVTVADQGKQHAQCDDGYGRRVRHCRCRAGLTDREIAGFTACSEESVSRIRRTYVDAAAVVVALSERIGRML